MHKKVKQIEESGFLEAIQILRRDLKVSNSP